MTRRVDRRTAFYESSLKAIQKMYAEASLALKIQSKKPSLIPDPDPLLWGRQLLEKSGIEEAIFYLHVSTIISLYHNWESHIPTGEGGSISHNWNKPKNRTHQELKEDAEKYGWPIHKDIDALQYAANCYKHNSAKWKKRLKEEWPHQFPEGSPIDNSLSSFYTKHPFTSELMEWLFEIAEGSILRRTTP